MSTPVQEFVWEGLRWLPRSDYEELLPRIDMGLTRGFQDMGYSLQSREKFLSLIQGGHNQPPDITNCFEGINGIVAFCYGCQKGHDVLHIHRVPTDEGKQLQDLESVLKKVVVPLLRERRLRSGVSELLKNYKHTLGFFFISIFGMLAQMRLINIPEPYSNVFYALLFFASIPSLVYISLWLLQAYYVYRSIIRGI